MTKIYDKYYITRTGKVFSRKSGELKQLKTYLSNSGKGYEMVDLYINGKYEKKLVHRLVALTFLEYIEGCVVDHKDDNPLNNHVSNLQWITQRENVHKSYNTLSQVRNYIGADLYKDGEYVNTFKSKIDACRYAVDNFGCKFSMIRKHNTHNGCEVRCNDYPNGE